MSIEELPADWQGEVRRLRRENQQQQQRNEARDALAALVLKGLPVSSAGNVCRFCNRLPVLLCLSACQSEGNPRPRRSRPAPTALTLRTGRALCWQMALFRSIRSRMRSGSTTTACGRNPARWSLGGYPGRSAHVPNPRHDHGRKLPVLKAVQ